MASSQTPCGKKGRGFWASGFQAFHRSIDSGAGRTGYRKAIRRIRLLAARCVSTAASSRCTGRQASVLRGRSKRTWWGLRRECRSPMHEDIAADLTGSCSRRHRPTEIVERHCRLVRDAHALSLALYSAASNCCGGGKTPHHGVAPIVMRAKQALLIRFGPKSPNKL